MKLPNESVNIYLSSVNLHENFLLIELQEILLLRNDIDHMKTSSERSPASQHARLCANGFSLNY